MLISVVIPTYNRSKHLKKTIFSLLNQQGNNNYEIIIIDDGSTDDTKLIVSNFKNKIIKYYYQDNKERGAARNLGIKKATGKYINFFDSDDLAYSTHIQTAINKIKRDRLDIFHLGHHIIYKKFKKTNNPEGDLFYRLIWGNIMLPISTFVKKSLAEEVMFSEERNLSGTEDYLFWLKILAMKRIFGYKEVTSGLVMHDGRSMIEVDPVKTEKRLKIFLSILRNDGIHKKFYFIVKSSCYLLISLDYSIKFYKFKSFKFLLLSLLICPLFLFNIRPYAVIKKLIIPKKFS